MRADYRHLLRALKDQGYEVTQAKSGHLKVYRDGRLVTTMPGSPSDGYRNLANTVAALRRHGGFVYPRKGER